MTSASSLAFPGSRTLATWWRQLAPYQPQSLGLGYLFIHRVEAAACRLAPSPLDPLLALALEAVALEEQSPATLANSDWRRLQRHLRLDTPVLGRLWRALTSLKLAKAKPNVAQVDQGAVVLTEAGREALRTGQLCARNWRREGFTFVETLDSAGQRRAPPHFMRILDAPAAPWTMKNGSAFDVAWLHDCLAQSAHWKKTFGFPADVIAIAAPGAEQAVSWDQVVLDKTERTLVVFCHGAGADPELFGFGVRPEGWAVNSTVPILRLPAAAGLFAELTSPDLAPWQSAWQAWCQARGVPPADARAAVLCVTGERLHVRAPASLLASLQAAKSDVFKGDTWITAGEGYLRRAGRMEMTEMS